MSRKGSAVDVAGTGRVSRRAALPWLVVTVALGAVAVIVGTVRFDALPDPYPIHFGPSGTADNHGAKTLVTVFTPVFMGVLSALAVLAVALTLPEKARRVVSPLAALGCSIGGGSSLIATAQYLSPDAVPPPWTFWAFLGLVVAATGWVIAAAVGAEREAARESGADANHWRWGLVYVNAENPDVFVPKRSGVGMTINFGRPMGWVVMALILVPALLIIYVVAALG